ncbi:uncharacterized protein ACA1_121440 [Acanthamoeba castellanii str. Neff]|uniref:Uncharacterized protein n=1 Tax=Acanthamoeba castellanii (strain ATCC 30010 / Neff) TaxID=1257118 RepID=L8GEI3_ACACF|nr:uncharacterized protein ACA1_121440 [Acanthamoeba castellanii str. Neff]ELR11437.1 hypothetical protein ACA1_121440 [Acanthamoeba castellanii str. Neff]
MPEFNPVHTSSSGSLFGDVRTEYAKICKRLLVGRHHRKDAREVHAPKRTEPDLLERKIYGGKYTVKQYDYGNVIRKVINDQRKEEEGRKKLRLGAPMALEEYYSPYIETGFSLVDGDKKLKDLRAALCKLDGLGFRRSLHQIAFHEAFIAACIAQIYGKDFLRHLVRITQENGFSDLRSEIGVVCPRRWGKTTAVSMFAAAFMWTQPDAEICIYSVARRASAMLLLKVLQMVKKLSGDDESIIVTMNQEELRIKTINGGTAVCRSYPGLPKGLMV